MIAFALLSALADTGAVAPAGASAPVGAAAQAADAVRPPPPDSASPAATACVAALPASAFARVPVFLDASFLDTAPAPAAVSAVELVAQDVAQRVQRRLAAAGPDSARGHLPSGDPAAPWWALGGSGIGVVAYRDGRFRWARVGGPGGVRGAMRPDTLLLDALQEARRDTALFVPEGAFAADSMAFVLSLGREEPRAPVPSGALPRQRAMVLFTIHAPEFRPAALAPGDPPEVEPPKRARGTRARLALAFTIDTTGRADSASIREVPTGAADDGGAFHEEFVRTAAAMVSQARYEPALVAGCRVRASTVQGFALGYSRAAVRRAAGERPVEDHPMSEPGRMRPAGTLNPSTIDVPIRLPQGQYPPP